MCTRRRLWKPHLLALMSTPPCNASGLSTEMIISTDTSIWAGEVQAANGEHLYWSCYFIISYLGNSGVVNIQSQKIFWTKTYNSLPMHCHWCPACPHSGMHMQPGQAKVQRARTKLVVIHWNWLQKHAKSCICSNLMVLMQNSHIWKLSWYNRWTESQIHSFKSTWCW